VLTMKLGSPLLDRDKINIHEVKSTKCR
jgi:hypothetical protein